MEIGGMMGDPRIVQAMSQQALIGSSHAFRQILETYDTRQIDKLVLDMPKLMQLVQAMPPQPQLPSGTEEPAQQ
jgi:Mrp family chromosome partitioning ATPase